MAGQAPAGKEMSNRAAWGCVGLVFLAIAGVVGYAELKGDPPSSSASSSSTSGQGDVPAPAPATSAQASPAQRLADLDGDVSPVADYQAALDALGPKCTQNEPFIAGLGDSGYSDLVKNGVKDETRLTVLRHLATSIPDSLGRTDCAQILSAYLVLREQG